jgi:regulator of sigma E protease
MNIIPIPALDGGYAFMLIIEMITRRKVSDKWVGYLNYVGLSLLLLLMLWANINDIIRAFF